MGVESPVAGKAGAVRIQRLGGVALSAAEAHGKRLDVNGRGRVVREAKPLSTTGLELASLYAAHVEGAKVQKSATKALHMVVQFPTELVNPDDAGAMLKHARSFAEDVFGTKAIFGDRVDRDEKGRHLVDLFIAPRYEKQTKRQSQTAISTSRHLKALATRYGRSPSLRGQGQALQDAWHEYLRDHMKLAVQRGKPKKRPGSDWQSAEELEAERLAREREALRQQSADLERRRVLLGEKIADMQAERRQLRAAKRELVNAAAKATAAARHLAAIIPADLVQALDRMRTVTRSAFSALGWIDAENRFTEKSGLPRREQDQLSAASKGIGHIVAAHEAQSRAAEIEDDEPGYDDGFTP